MIFWITALLALLLDRISKIIVLRNMVVGQTIPVIHDFFHFTYVRNPGAAFGILAEKKWLFIVATFAILIVLFYFVHTTESKGILMSVSLGMIAGGAVGNLWDRLQIGMVIDFLDFRGVWPYIFNIADSFIVVGVLVLICKILLSEQI